MCQKTCIAPRFHRRSTTTQKRLLFLFLPRLFRRLLFRENSNPDQTPNVPCLPIPFTKSSAELSEAINSMRQWYANSRVCYTYLHDVHGSSAESNDEKYLESNG